MDTLLGLRSWKSRATDWVAAAVAGFAAGALLMVLDLIWSAIFNPGGPWRTAHMIAPVFLGVDALRTTGYGFNAGVVAVALGVHYVMGTLFGVVAGWVLAQLELDDRPVHAGTAGAAMGILLYLFNFHFVVVRALPWLAELVGGPTLTAHVVFGAVTGLLYWRLNRLTER
ncbi:MAG TPA: hypothetical protein VFM98_20915 [Ramlibacter sp.]|uniref:hypothetical protein n=1 Tax=Ramlibacter sp. TaxID=1917967 RepID=UPI002D803EA1|nr:hypothetical protein [Ramlibacter sp.]HET8748071.1 hypothetical protein [Ramlibacter sp.]